MQENDGKQHWLIERGMPTEWFAELTISNFYALQTFWEIVGQFQWWFEGNPRHLRISFDPIARKKIYILLVHIAEVFTAFPVRMPFSEIDAQFLKNVIYDEMRFTPQGRGYIDDTSGAYFFLDLLEIRSEVYKQKPPRD